MKKSEIFGKNRTNEISVHFSFRGSPKNDISAKHRPKKPKFLSMDVTNHFTFGSQWGFKGMLLKRKYEEFFLFIFIYFILQYSILFFTDTFYFILYKFILFYFS